ncbi:TonB-dependent receptor plug domain-containing protein [Roseovarius dicentrarchi]|uniref:TonB-dependent receptor plug domain-containing protein n=1 Tax=Roseovarius dicentrarchi TaxID=2250573 RepID=UPI000DE87BC5|nr:TonB-dependent receptor [Roseovarius dicentrarchi]
MKRNTFALLAATTSLIASAAAAQQTYDLGTIVLSGGFTPVEASKYGRAASVITRQDIEAQNARYVTDILRTIPGVSVSRAGSSGAVTSVRLRGHESNHTLVLIDGVEVAYSGDGTYDFAGLLAQDIERIEVLRGAQSSIYGSNAIGGVVSITSKRADEPGLTGEVAVEIGSNNTSTALMALRAKAARGDLSFSVARQETDGFDVSQTPGGEKDGHLNTTYNLNGRYYLTDAVTVGGALRYTDRITDADTFNFGAPTTAGLVTDTPLAENESQELFGSVFAEIALMDGRLENRIDLSFGEIDRKGRNGAGVKDQDSTGTNAKIAYRGTVALDAATVAAADHLLTFAAEWERLTYKENDPAIVFGPGQLVKRTREQTGIVMEYQGSITPDFNVQASVRHDFNDKFEDFTTYAVGASYTLPNQTTRLHASYGTGVQNPTLIEQFGFFTDFVGNPNLKPEQSEGWDIGIEQQFLDGRAIIDLTYFDETLEDEIGSEFVPALGASRPINNIGKSDRRGIEIAGRTDITDRLGMTIGYTWLDATEPVPVAAGGIRNAIEVRRPEHQFSLGVNYAFPDDRTRFNLDATHIAGLYDLDFKTASFISGNADDDFDRVKLSDYTLVNMNITHDLNDRVRIIGGVRNLLDESYEELEGYGTEGRTFYVGLTSTF